MRKFLLVAGLAALVSGCGEKGDFEKAINAKISQSKLCYSLQVDLPLYFQTPVIT